MSHETPLVVDHGQLTEITAGQSDGEYTDAAFPVITPRALLTFSD